MIEPIDILTTVTYGMGLTVGWFFVQSGWDVVIFTTVFLLVQMIMNHLRGTA
jgi:hypothetical protein